MSRKPILRRLSPALVVLAAALAACGPAREKEPNDDFGSATVIKPGGIQGALGKASDVDIYRLDNESEPAAMSARLTGIREADFVISVYDKDHRELKRYDETAEGGDEEVADIGLGQGAYYLKISNKNEKFNNAGQPYALELKVARGPGREQEPDDTPQTASRLELPGVTRGHYFPSRQLLAGDTDYLESDWYKLDMPQAGLFLLNIDVSEVAKVDSVFEIYDSNGYKIKEVDSGSAGQGESLKNFGVRGPVQFTMRLSAKSGGANADAAYEILTEVIPYQGKTEFEANDQRVDATPFSQESINGTIAPVGDEDWYKIDVADDAKQLLRVSLTGIDGMDLVLKVCDALGTPLLTLDNMGKGQPEVLTGLGVTKGEYYLVVSEKSGRKASADQGYTLTKTLTPWQGGLEYEINDATATAQQLKVGEAVDGYLGWKGDVDYFEFNAYQKGTIVFELAGVLNVQPALTLFDQEGNVVQTWTAAKPGESLSFDKELEAGTYSLSLRAAKEDQNNVRDKYSLRLRAR